MKFLKERSASNRSLPTIALLLFSLCAILINTKPGTIIMGLDNASPWFGLYNVITMVKNSTSFIEVGPILFSPFLILGTSLGLSASALSYLMYWGCLFLGVAGTYKLLKTTFTDIKILLPLLALFLGSLFTLWIFSQPSYLFLHAFASIPWIIVLLQESITYKRPLDFVGKLLGICAFLVTFINPVAFFSYTLCVFILAYVLGNISKQKMELVVKNTCLFLLATLLFIQVTVLIVGRKNSLVTELQLYTQEQLNSDTNLLASDGLRQSEIENNSFLNVVRFATGWMELNDLKQQNLFQYKDLYQKNLAFILLELAPLLISLWWTIRRKKSHQEFLLFYIFLAAVILASSYFLILIGGVPYLKDAWRWPTSKIWPLIVIPPLFFIGNFLKTISLEKKYLTKIVLVFGIIQMFPWFTGALRTPYATNVLPDSYLQLNKLSIESKILVLPQPQKGFFRSYIWGYYGTDFISFITPATVIDGTRTNTFNKAYDSLLTLNPEELNESGINYILVDKSTSTPIRGEQQKALDLLPKKLNTPEFILYIYKAP